MPRPSQIDEQRKRLLPIVCEVFSELGYHRTTTAELAATVRSAGKHPLPLVAGQKGHVPCRY